MTRKSDKQLLALGLVRFTCPAKAIELASSRIDAMLKVKAQHVFTGAPLIDSIRSVAIEAYLQGVADASEVMKSDEPQP